MLVKAWGGCVAAIALLLAACAQAPTQESAKNASLYERLGGKPAITAVVDDFVGNIAEDQRINKFFVHADPVKLKRHLVDQICAVSGGPCKYTGRDMKTTHQDMAITEAHFNAVVGDLVKSLDKFKVSAQEKNELLALLGAMKNQIVNTK
jgi:hemoglobin